MMNRTVAFVIVGALLGSGAAFGQSSTTNPPPAASSSDSSAPASAPAPGKAVSSKAAHKQLKGQGYTHVKGLKKDDQGAWHGTAKKNGNTVNVSVDTQGNVTEQ